MPPLATMEDYVSESDSDYTSYWRDWVSTNRDMLCVLFPGEAHNGGREVQTVQLDPDTRALRTWGAQ